MPSWSASRGSYRLLPDEVDAMFGLATELRGLVVEGLRAAQEAGRIPLGVDPMVGFWEELKRARHKDAETRFLFGFGAARPLGEADRVELGRRLHVEAGRLACRDEPGALYEVSGVLEAGRVAAGVTRTRLARGCEDPTRVLNVVGMVMVTRKRLVSLRQVLHAGWREDSVVEAGRLAARWPAAMTGRGL